MGRGRKAKQEEAKIQRITNFYIHSEQFQDRKPYDGPCLMRGVCVCKDLSQGHSTICPKSRSAITGNRVWKTNPAPLKFMLPSRHTPESVLPKSGNSTTRSQQNRKKRKTPFSPEQWLDKFTENALALYEGAQLSVSSPTTVAMHPLILEDKRVIQPNNRQQDTLTESSIYTPMKALPHQQPNSYNTSYYTNWKDKLRVIGSEEEPESDTSEERGGSSASLLLSPPLPMSSVSDSPTHSSTEEELGAESGCSTSRSYTPLLPTTTTIAPGDPGALLLPPSSPSPASSFGAQQQEEDTSQHQQGSSSVPCISDETEATLLTALVPSPQPPSLDHQHHPNHPQQIHIQLGSNNDICSNDSNDSSSRPTALTTHGSSDSRALLLPPTSPSSNSSIHVMVGGTSPDSLLQPQPQPPPPTIPAFDMAATGHPLPSATATSSTYYPNNDYDTNYNSTSSQVVLTNHHHHNHYNHHDHQQQQQQSNCNSVNINSNGDSPTTGPAVVVPPTCKDTHGDHHSCHHDEVLKDLLSHLQLESSIGKEMLNSPQKKKSNRPQSASSVLGRNRPSSLLPNSAETPPSRNRSTYSRRYKRLRNSRNNTKDINNYLVPQHCTSQQHHNDLIQAEARQVAEQLFGCTSTQEGGGGGGGTSSSLSPSYSYCCWEGSHPTFGTHKYSIPSIQDCSSYEMISSGSASPTTNNNKIRSRGERGVEGGMHTTTTSSTSTGAATDRCGSESNKQHQLQGRPGSPSAVSCRSPSPTSHDRTEVSSSSPTSLQRSPLTKLVKVRSGLQCSMGVTSHTAVRKKRMEANKEAKREKETQHVMQQLKQKPYHPAVARALKQSKTVQTKADAVEKEFRRKTHNELRGEEELERRQHLVDGWGLSQHNAHKRITHLYQSSSHPTTGVSRESSLSTRSREEAGGGPTTDNSNSDTAQTPNSNVDLGILTPTTALQGFQQQRSPSLMYGSVTVETVHDGFTVGPISARSSKGTPKSRKFSVYSEPRSPGPRSPQTPKTPVPFGRIPSAQQLKAVVECELPLEAILPVTPSKTKHKKAVPEVTSVNLD